MTRVPKQVYIVLGLKGPKFQIFTAKFYKSLFRSILVLISPKVLAVWLHLNRSLVI
jgi:hypothetical protein